MVEKFTELQKAALDDLWSNLNDASKQNVFEVLQAEGVDPDVINKFTDAVYDVRAKYSDPETSKKKLYFRTKVSFVVLSTEPIEELDLMSIYEADQDDLVVGDTNFEREVISAKDMACNLYAVGSDPGFFQLNDEGKEVKS